MGYFLNTEGGDGSGKATQTRLIADFGRDLGLNVHVDAFPRYHTETGKKVRAYLAGEYGDKLNPKQIAQLYADDRLAARDEMMPFLIDPNGLTTTDRFTSSNAAHMGSFILDASARHDFYEYIRENEHEVMGIPKPDLNIILMIPARVSLANIASRNLQNGTVAIKDIHEEDGEHLTRALASYGELARTYPEEYLLINCMETYDAMRSIEDIQAEIRTAIRPLLVR